MNYPWRNDYILAKKGVIREVKAEWNDAIVYFLGEKMIAMETRNSRKKDEGKPIFTVKGDPIVNSLLRDEYEDIIPGWHMNKQHWISVFLDGNVPDDIFEKIIDDAYEIILESLSAKKRAEILA